MKDEMGKFLPRRTRRAQCSIAATKEGRLTTRFARGHRGTERDLTPNLLHRECCVNLVRKVVSIGSVISESRKSFLPNSRNGLSRAESRASSSSGSLGRPACSRQRRAGRERGWLVLSCVYASLGVKVEGGKRNRGRSQETEGKDSISRANCLSKVAI